MTEWTAEQQREHRKLWVEALRSGKYQQAKSVLKNAAGGMCCLGVACDISHLGAWDGDGYYRTDGDYSAKILPRQVQSWLGLKHCDGNFGSSDNQLTVLNDTGATFERIAEIIESEPTELIATPKPVEA